MAQLNFRIDDNIKIKAENACNAMGLTISAAINIFLTKVANEKEYLLILLYMIPSIVMNI